MKISFHELYSQSSTFSQLGKELSTLLKTLQETIEQSKWPRESRSFRALELAFWKAKPQLLRFAAFLKDTGAEMRAVADYLSRCDTSYRNDPSLASGELHGFRP